MRRIVTGICMSMALGLGACGNPAMEKDLKKEEEKRREAEAKAQQQDSDIAVLKAMLTHVYVSDNHLWVVAGVYSSYESAAGQCAYIGYTLPDTAELDEFMTQVFPHTHPEWQKYDRSVFPVEGAPVVREAGPTLCRLNRAY